MAELNSGVYQYPQPRVPGTWTGERKQFVVWLTDVLDDIYKRYGRLDFSDFSQQVQDWIAGMNEWPDSLRGEFDASLAELAANLAGNISEVNALVLTLQQIQNGTIADVADLLARLANTDAHIIEVEQTINMIEGEVSTKVSESDFFALAGQVNSNSTEILQNAYAIELKANETYVDTLNGVIQEQGALIEVLKTMIGLQVYQINYNSGPIESGDVFPMNPNENDGFIYTGGDIPRFYVYLEGDWVEFANQLLITSGIVIEPDHVAINTPNFQLQLTDTANNDLTLVGITQDGMLLQDKQGNLVFNFNTTSGDLSLSGTIFARGGVIGGFVVNNNTLSTDNFLLDASGVLRIGPVNNPYFTVNSSSTTISNAFYIKPGTLPVTNLRPNLYYDVDTGQVYRTTWSGSGTSLTAILQVSPSSLAIGGQFLFGWTVSGGTAPYSIAWTLKYSNGTTYMSGTGNTPSNQFYVNCPTTAGGYFFALTATDADGSIQTATYNVTVTAAQPPVSNLSVSLSNSGGSAYLSISGGSGSYSIAWYYRALADQSGQWRYLSVYDNSTYVPGFGSQGEAYFMAVVTDNNTGASATSNSVLL
jgi:hypothetical protein